MAPKDRDKTAFTTPKGFGSCLLDSVEHQRPSKGFIRGLESFAVVYLDDIVIFSETWQDHLQHIRGVFDRLKNNLTAKLKKCQFAMNECTYLGHVVGNGQVRPDPAKLKAVARTISYSNNKTTCQRISWTYGYYRKFIRDYARLASSFLDGPDKETKSRQN